MITLDRPDRPDRPDRLDAFDVEMLRALLAAFDRTEAAAGDWAGWFPTANCCQGRRLASEIAGTAWVAVRLTRHLLWRGLTFDHPMGAHRSDSRAIQALVPVPTCGGGRRLLAKRDPVCSMRPSTDTPEVLDQESPRFG